MEFDGKIDALRQAQMELLRAFANLYLELGGMGPIKNKWEEFKENDP
jgi:hypothetical protein